MSSARSIARIEANRRNALRSTGPRTVEGKRRSSLNAVRHGLLARTPVLLHVEAEEDWEAHVMATVDALAPVGHVETMLAERIALLSWRLGRVARYESEELSHRQERVVDRVHGDRIRAAAWAESSNIYSTATPSQLEELVAIDREACDAIHAFLDACAAKELEAVAPTAAYFASVLVARAAGVDSGEWDRIELEDGRVLGKIPFEEWSGPIAFDTGFSVAARSGQDVGQDELPRAVSDLFTSARNMADRQLAQGEKELAKVRRSIAHRRTDHLMLPALDVQLLCRYESHLERGMYRALHELQRLQAARNSELVLAPIAVDVGGG